MKPLLRFNDLVEGKIVKNRQTLQNWKRRYGFPAGRLLSPNCRAWTPEEIADWLASRPSEDPEDAAA
jgi:hypothetical protein